MQKPITIIFCGNAQGLGSQLAAKMRTGLNTVQLCAATPYIYGYDAQKCERVIIMPDVHLNSRNAIKKVYPIAEDYALEVEPVIPPVRRRRGRPPKIRNGAGAA